MTLPVTFSLIKHELKSAHRSWSLLAVCTIGGTLVVMALVLGATLQQRVNDGASINYEGADLVVRTQTGAAVGGVGNTDAASGSTGSAVDQSNASGSSAPSLSPTDVEQIGRLDGVTAAAGLTRARAGLWVGSQVSPTIIESLPSDQFRWQHLAGGRFPQTGTEVALSAATLAAHELHLGDTITLGTDLVGNGQFTIVGEVDTRGALDYESTAYALVTPPLAQAFAATDGANEVRVRVAPGTPIQAVIDAINTAVPGAWPESTAALVRATETTYDIGLGALALVINGFTVATVAIAFTVMGTVVWASLPSRRRQLALMRLAGATRGQLVAVVIAEAAVIALVAGLIAIPLGIGLAYLAVPALRAIPSVPSIPWSAVIVPLWPLVMVPVAAVVGAALTVILPALRAGRVPPAAALRDSASVAPIRSRATIVWLVLVLLLALATLAVPQLFSPWAAAATAAVFLLVLIIALPALYHGGAGMATRLVGPRRPLTELGATEIRSAPDAPAPWAWPPCSRPP